MHKESINIFNSQVNLVATAVETQRCDSRDVDSVTEAGDPLDTIEEDWPWEVEDDDEPKEEVITTNEIEIKEKIAPPISVTPVERGVEGISFEPTGDITDFNSSSISSPTMQYLASVCAVCNEAALMFVDGRFSRLGEPTEAALKVLVEKMGIPSIEKSKDPFLMVRQCNDYWNDKYKKLATLEFSRDRKSMSVLCKAANGENYLMVKGAAEVMLSKCSRVQLEDGRVIPLSDEIRVRLKEKIDEMARRPLRCLAMAYKTGNELGTLGDIRNEEEAAISPLISDPNNFVLIEKELTLLGVCGIKDPARLEAAEAIKTCHEAGIRVIMITGDSKETAMSIAKEVNIFDAAEEAQVNAFTGHEFFNFPHEQQLHILRSGNKVFCRAEPIHKQKLISLLSTLGEITAMTGDGVNDAPALQQADIGIAMGITGSEVAKDASDMVLADDNFATIVTAIEEGRSIYANMQSFICFLISCNIGEIFVVFFAALLGIPEPFSPILLLWLNLVTDGPPATALGFNPADPRVMQLPPRPRQEPILSKWLLFRYLITGLYVSFATIGIYLWWYIDKGITVHQLRHWGECSSWEDFPNTFFHPDLSRECEVFTKFRSIPQTLSLSALVTLEMLKALSAVSLDASLLRIPPWKNKWLVPAVSLPFLLHIITLYTPALAKVFGLAPLSLREWKVSLYLHLFPWLPHTDGGDLFTASASR